MNTTAQLSESLRSVFVAAPRGVVGLVDDLLALCPERGLELRYQGTKCRVDFVEDAIGSPELIELPLRKSVFRAILARIAALCIERRSNSVSPYGGQGEWSIDGASPAVYDVTFANTADDQWLKLIPRAPG